MIGYPYLTTYFFNGHKNSEVPVGCRSGWIRIIINLPLNPDLGP
jgi:hypothetical protein